MTKQRTILRYAGGKSRAIKKITPFIEPYEEIVSPFIGGGSLEVHWASMGKKVFGADVFDILVNFWDVLLSDPEMLAEELQKIAPNKQEYSVIKEKLMCTPQVQSMLAHWKSDFYKRDAVALSREQLAAYYYFNHNCSYGPGFLGWASDIYMNQDKWNKTINKVRNFKCENLSVAHQSFETTIQSNPSKFLYLDPPYYLKKDGDNKMLGGIYPMKNIPVHHDSFDHEKLRDLLLSHDGDFVMSYNNCETIREWYGDFELFYPEWHYSMDVGEKRIGKNRKQRVADGDVSEIERLTQQISDLELLGDPKDKKRIADLKTERHNIVKKESHEILIVKR